MRAFERVDVDTNNNINVIDLRVQNFVRTEKKRHSNRKWVKCIWPNLSISVCALFSLVKKIIYKCMRANTYADSYFIQHGNWNANVCCNYAIA